MEHGSWDGEWWLPSRPDARVQGTLVLNGEQFALGTSGFLDPPPAAEPGTHYADPWESRRYPVVFGTLADGRDATLIDVTGLATVVRLFEGTEQWHTRVALLGVHAEHPEELPFSFASLHLDHLDAFAGLPRPGAEFSFDETTNTVMEISLHASRQVLRSAILPWGTAQLVITPAIFGSDNRSTITVTVSLDVHVNEPVSWTAMWTDRLLPLRDLLAVLLGRATPVQSITMGSRSPAATTVLFRLPEPTMPPNRKIMPHDYVLTAEALPGGFEQALPQWYEVWTTHKVAVQVLTDLLHTSHAYIDDQLVSYVRALGPIATKVERAEADCISAAEHAAWLHRVEDALPEELRDSVIGNLTEPPVNDRQRLIAVVHGLGEAGKWLTADDIEGYAQRVVATRVKAAHPSSNPPRHALDGDALVVHTLALGWILRSVLIHRMGMPLDDLLTVLQHSSAAAVIANLASARAQL
jgi:hypothetical protein